MKTYSLICISATAAMLFASVSCKRALPPSAVSFPNSGIAINPGDDWQLIDTNKFAVLKGQGRYEGISILVDTSSSPTDAQTMAAIIKGSYAAFPGALPGSFKQEDFSTTSGIHGIHVSYEYTSTKQGQVGRIRGHTYYFQNKKGLLVGISYAILSDRDSDVIYQMIRQTLILQ